MVRALMASASGRGALKDPLIGQVIQGRYRIGRTIGSGGMGVVYEAQHLLIGRKVAVKVLTARGLLSNAGVVRFRREAQAAAAVGNSHVVDVLDMGQLDDGSLYIVLEHLEGGHLGWAAAQSGPFSVGRAVHVMCQLCDALSAVHAAGIVHRDLKPENIFLIERDGEPDFVKVLDFGVCRFEERDGVSLTASGDMIGTPLFMAPEQVENQASIDHRTDVYALGALLHFLLTGRAPFEAGTLPKLFIRICVEPPPSLRAADPSLPAELDAIVSRALSKSPELRFESCAALKQALLRFHEASPMSQTRRKDELAVTLPASSDASYQANVAPENASAPPAGVSKSKGRQRLLKACIVGLGALSGLGVFLLSSGSPNEPAAAPVLALPTPELSKLAPSEAANPVSPASPVESSNPAKPAAVTSAPRRAQPREQPPARRNDLASPTAPLVTTDEPLPVAVEPPAEPLPAPPPTPAVTASSRGLRLNQGPKVGL
jgi:eukaryotic-like serine/threonine-protein kinase